MNLKSVEDMLWDKRKFIYFFVFTEFREVCTLLFASCSKESVALFVSDISDLEAQMPSARNKINYNYIDGTSRCRKLHGHHRTHRKWMIDTRAKRRERPIRKIYLASLRGKPADA